MKTQGWNDVRVKLPTLGEYVVALFPPAYGFGNSGPCLYPTTVTIAVLEKDGWHSEDLGDGWNASHWIALPDGTK